MRRFVATLFSIGLGLSLSGAVLIAWGYDLLPEHENVPGETSQRPHGKIDFETFRMISTGMTREELLKLAGPPAGVRNEMVWVYYRDDGWLVEVTFSKFGQVASVTSARQR